MSILEKFWRSRSTYSENWKKCPGCGEDLRIEDIPKNNYVCDKCNYHMRMPIRDRIKLLVDEGTFSEIFQEIIPVDPINFVDSKPYTQRVSEAIEKNLAKEGEDGNILINEAIAVGKANIDGIPVLLGVMNFDFMGGSMGSVVGERVTRLFEEGFNSKLPVIIVTSSGGARMQEGIFSLMQMAKTSAAVMHFKHSGLPYISVMADPTTGGVSASFATLGDINIAEPGALVGFAGPRVIEQTIRQKLPRGFQRSQFLLEHGMIDSIVDRSELKASISKLLRLLMVDRGA
ncbi:MAG: acetyl-CoA carboxylase carboxyltransferase subunit beta [Candidatus Riflebacteria bacterium]|nr:acetyl-CoA carboxylase carboxyltransferase subunit beta [Candidatus Riflebacteria bacterium]